MRIFHLTYMQAWMGHIMYLMSVERSLRQVHAGRKKNVLSLVVRALKMVSGTKFRITFGEKEISIRRCPLMPQIGEKFDEQDWDQLVLKE